MGDPEMAMKRLGLERDARRRARQSSQASCRSRPRTKGRCAIAFGGMAGDPGAVRTSTRTPL